MDRQIVYPGQILPETALLQMAKDAMIGSAKLAAAVLGTSTIANGFAVTPTGPASLLVAVAPGEIYALTNIDSLAFSTLPADTTHSILKQGIMLDGVTLSCPAPTTTGQSINYLVQVTYQDQDSTPVLLPYYNSANPALPYSGMGNNGVAQNTARKGVAIVQVKAGASAATGSQNTPSPDSGYVGLYVVTVANGQTKITSTSIKQYSGAPLLNSGIIQAIQNEAFTYSPDIGAVNAYAANYSPAVTSLVDGMVLTFKAANTNTNTSTFSPNGVTPKPIVNISLSGLPASSILANGQCAVSYSQAIDSWVLIYSLGVGTSWSTISSKPTTLAGYGITDAYTKTEAGQSFASKAYTLAGYNIGDTYTATQSDNRYAVKATTLAGYGITDAYTKTVCDTSFASKATTLAGYNIGDAYTRAQVDTLLSGKANNVAATESVAGIAAVATQSQTNAGADDATIVTPKKLRAGFVSSFTTNGFIAFPTWLGGLVIQWGRTAVLTDGSGVNVSLPFTFPATTLQMWTSLYGSVSGDSAACRVSAGQFVSLSQINVSYNETNSALGGSAVTWLCVGF
ncbi:hypothetical protein ACM9HO_03195 [Pseudomonas sp. KHB2.9]